MLPRSMGLRGILLGDAASVLLGRDNRIRFNDGSYCPLPPRPSDHRVFGELELSHHAPAGMRSYAINPVASGGGFRRRYGGAVGVTLSDEPQLLPVNLVRSNGSQALTGHYMVGILPQSDFPSAEEHVVVSGRQVIPLVGVSNLEPGNPSASTTPRSCEFRWTPCNTTAGPPALPLAHLA